MIYVGIFDPVQWLWTKTNSWTSSFHRSV